jgi:hypothetical protein
MADQVFYNVVKFRGITLRAEGEWTWDAGVRPSQFNAVASYIDIEAMQASAGAAKVVDWGAAGELQFYFDFPPNAATGKADLTLKGWRIIDVQGINPLRVVADPSKVRFTEYRLTLADARDQFEFPRGGTLLKGDLNREPLNADGSKDAYGRTVVTIQKMVQWCVDAMGANLTVPQELSDVPKIFNVEWRGNHAPTELARILEHARYTFCVKRDGTFTIEPMGKGTAPTPPPDRTTMDAPYPGVDRRGAMVVFSSAPLATVNTGTLTVSDGDGDSDAELEWVVMEEDGGWEVLKDAKILEKQDPETIIRNNFENIKAVNRQRVRNFLYSAVRVRRDQAGPQPMMRYAFDKFTSAGGASGAANKVAWTQIKVLSKGLIVDASGTGFKLPDDYVEVPATQLMDHGRVLVLRYTQGKFADGKRSGDLKSDFVKLDRDDLRVRVTREVWEKQSDQEWEPHFRRYGFIQEVGGIRALTDSEIETNLASGKAAFISEPRLREVRYDDAIQNATESKSLARSLATAYIGGSGNEAKVVGVAGYFAGVELSGLVNQVRYNLSTPMTTYKMGSWFFPNDRPQLPPPPLREKFPRHAETSARRVGEGTAGGMQPTVPIHPPGPTTPTVRIIRAKVLAKAAGAGEYTYAEVSGGSKATESTDFKFPGDGEKVGTQQGLLCNLLEHDKANTHWLNIAGTGAGVTGVLAMVVGETDKDAQGNTKPIAYTVAPHPHGAFVVDLTKDGGIDGDAGSMPNYTYTVKSLSGDELAKLKQPQFRFGDKGKHSAATRGVGYYDFEGKFNCSSPWRRGTTANAEHDDDDDDDRGGAGGAGGGGAGAAGAADGQDGGGAAGRSGRAVGGADPERTGRVGPTAGTGRVPRGDPGGVGRVHARATPARARPGYGRVPARAGVTGREAVQEHAAPLGSRASRRGRGACRWPDRTAGRVTRRGPVLHGVIETAGERAVSHDHGGVAGRVRSGDGGGCPAPLLQSDTEVFEHASKRGQGPFERSSKGGCSVGETGQSRPGGQR